MASRASLFFHDSIVGAKGRPAVPNLSVSCADSSPTKGTKASPHRPFLARQVLTAGKCKTVAKTES